MLLNGLLPIGSVVLLKESTKKVMIVGLCQKSTGESGKLYDYAGVMFPEGYFAADQLFLFNGDQIAQLYAIGYQDADQLAFKEKADELMSRMRAQ